MAYQDWASCEQLIRVEDERAHLFRLLRPLYPNFPIDFNPVYERCIKEVAADYISRPDMPTISAAFFNWAVGRCLWTLVLNRYNDPNSNAPPYHFEDDMLARYGAPYSKAYLVEYAKSEEANMKQILASEEPEAIKLLYMQARVVRQRAQKEVGELMMAIGGKGPEQIAKVLDFVRDPRFGCLMKNELSRMVKGWVKENTPIYLSRLAEQAAQQVGENRKIMATMDAMEQFVMDRESDFAVLVDSEEERLEYGIRVLITQVDSRDHYMVHEWQQELVAKIHEARENDNEKEVETEAKRKRNEDDTGNGGNTRPYKRRA